MRVLLINPPRFNEIIGNNPSIIEEERGFNPPLGLLYIAGYIRRHTPHEVSLIDAQAEKLDYSSLRGEVATRKPDLVGITAMTMTLIDVLETTRMVKRVDDQMITVLGGPHVHLFPDETIRFDSVDYLVLGEGEQVFADLLEGIRTDGDLQTIKGIVYKKNGVPVHTGARPLIDDLDDLPFPPRQLLDCRKYGSLLFKEKVVTTLFTSRGCPFHCSFCDRPHLGKRFRARSAKNVVDEIAHCTTLGIRNFLIYDDTFTVQKDRVMRICDEILARGLNISWDIRSRVDTVDEAMLIALKKAGCQGIHYGIEAGTNEILKRLNKGIRIEQVEETFNLTRKHGIPILAYFMIGNPGEGKTEIDATFAAIKRLKPDYLHLTILTPFPGTQIYRDGLADGTIVGDPWRAFARNPTPDFVPPHWGEFFPKESLNQLLVKGYRSFYLRPSYLLRSFLKLRSPSELKRKASAGAKLFKMKAAKR